jgi:hypothetical protein
MRAQKFSAWFVVAVLSVVGSLGFASQANAQITYGNDLNLGGTYPSTPNFYSYDNAVGGSGGPITPSFLNGYALPFVYCLDIPDDVAVPHDYTNSGVSSNAEVVYTNLPGKPGTSPLLTTTNGVTTLTNASQIAGLLNEYGAAVSGNVTKEDALQAAIWTEVYGYDTNPSPVGGNPYGFYVTDTATYNQMLVYLGGTTTAGSTSTPTAAVNSAVWLTPSDNGAPQGLQALVTVVPEPSTFALAGLGALGLVGYGFRRRRIKGV